MDTIVAGVLTSVGVTILGFVFNKFNLSGHVKRAVVFGLSLIGAAIQLAILHKLGIVASDPTTWYVAVTSVVGGAQVLYTLLAKPLGLGANDTPVNPT